MAENKLLEKACDDPECPCVPCRCGCHGLALIDHMFECCFPANCKRCGKELSLSADFPGVNEWGVAWETQPRKS